MVNSCIPLRCASKDLEFELEDLGIDAAVNYQPTERNGPNVICYESILVMFKNKQDMNLYKAVGEYQENGENIIFDCPAC